MSRVSHRWRHVEEERDLVAEIEKVLSENPGLTRAKVREAVTGRNEEILGALRNSDRFTPEKGRGNTEHWHLRSDLFPTPRNSSEQVPLADAERTTQRSAVPGQPEHVEDEDEEPG